jgi:hypothetical protein
MMARGFKKHVKYFFGVDHRKRVHRARLCCSQAASGVAGESIGRDRRPAATGVSDAGGVRRLRHANTAAWVEGTSVEPIGLGTWAMGGWGWLFGWGAQDDAD